MKEKEEPHTKAFTNQREKGKGGNSLEEQNYF